MRVFWWGAGSTFWCGCFRGLNHCCLSSIWTGFHEGKVFLDFRGWVFFRGYIFGNRRHWGSLCSSVFTSLIGRSYKVRRKKLSFLHGVTQLLYIPSLLYNQRALAQYYALRHSHSTGDGHTLKKRWLRFIQAREGSIVFNACTQGVARVQYVLLERVCTR